MGIGGHESRDRKSVCDRIVPEPAKQYRLLWSISPLSSFIKEITNEKTTSIVRCCYADPCSDVGLGCGAEWQMDSACTGSRRSNSRNHLHVQGRRRKADR